MRRRLGIGVCALGSLVAMLWGIGSLLPADHVAACRVRLAQPRERIFAVITDFASHPTWREDVERVDVLDATPDHQVMREHGGNGPLDVRVERVDRPRALVTRVADPDGNFEGTWTFELERIAGATQLVITERGTVHSALFRLLSRTVFSTTATMEQYQQALGRRFSENVFTSCEVLPAGQ